MNEEKTRTRYRPGEFVGAGVYWNRKKALDFAFIPEEGGTLPGGAEGTYRKLPVLLLMGVGPIIGLGFIVFLPVAVPAVLIYQGWKALSRRFAQRVADATEPGAEYIR